VIDLLKTGFLYGWLLTLGLVDRVYKWVRPSAKAKAYQYTTAEQVEIAGCPNTYRIDDVLYRGAQPTHDGFKELEKRGIHSVLCLRSLHDNDHTLSHTNLQSFHIKIKTWDPKPEHVHEFLSIVSRPENQPVFVHCLHGSDRTGVMVAAYRMVMQDYSHAQATKEMVKGPFGFHRIWDGLPKFLGELDIESLRAEFHPQKERSCLDQT
jgi:protein tyrosine phosphatase (PTP) superfamily phosphohydrolase (DUF442 family)